MKLDVSKYFRYEFEYLMVLINGNMLPSTLYKLVIELEENKNTNKVLQSKFVQHILYW